MKRFLIILSFIICSFPLFAQMSRVRDAEYFPRNEIYVQYGTPTVIELSSTLGAKYNFNNISGDSENYKFSGVGGVGYNFYVSSKIAVGVYGGVGYASADLFIDRIGDDLLKEPVRLCRSEVVSYVGEVSGIYTYWREGAMELSGAVYVGVAYLDENIRLYIDDETYGKPFPNDRWKFAYHLTALKFRIGETVGGFAELGFGYRGLVNVGLSVKI